MTATPPRWPCLALALLIVALPPAGHAHTDDASFDAQLGGAPLQLLSFDVDDHDVPAAGLTQDTSQNGNHARRIALASVPGTYAGAPSAAYQWDGTSSHLDLVESSASQINHLRRLTTSVWIRTTQSDAARGTCNNAPSAGETIFYYSSGDDQGAVMLYVDRDGYVSGFIRHYLNKRDGNVRSSTFVGDGQWHHVALAFSGANNSLYVDGALEAVGSTPNGAFGSHTYAVADLGSSAYALGVCTNRYRGSMDEFRLWEGTPSHATIDEGRLTPYCDDVHCDAFPPRTTLDLAGPAGLGRWFVDDASVALTAVDGGSGVSATEFSLDGGPPFEPYGGPLAIGEGDYDFAFRSIDAAGNVEPLQVRPFGVDKRAPSTTLDVDATPSPDLPGWFMGPPPRATLIAVDNGPSGVAASQYRLGGGAWINATGAVALPDGETTLGFRSLDGAGWVEAEHAFPYKSDATAPLVSSSRSGTQGATNRYFRSNVTVACAATDALTGIAALTIQLDGGSYVPYAGPVEVAGERRHTYTCRARDGAGNVGSLFAEFYIDLTPIPFVACRPKAGHSYLHVPDALDPPWNEYVDVPDPKEFDHDAGPSPDGRSRLVGNRMRIGCQWPGDLTGAWRMEASIDEQVRALSFDWETGRYKYDWTPGFTPSAHTVQFRFTDGAGNVSEGGVVTILVNRPV